MKYDYLIVGAGFFGAICAFELQKKGYSVAVIDKRSHIGGNCFTSERDGIQVHDYGPHIFHTSNKEVWEWINQFADFNHYRVTVVGNSKNEVFSLPFNMWTFSKLLGVSTPKEVQDIIEEDSKEIKEPTNLEEQAIKSVGKVVYSRLIRDYIIKQWGKHPKELPVSIIKRLPVRFTYDNNYYQDTYQGIPIGGYTQIFSKLLNGIPVFLNTDYFIDTLPEHTNLIYTGPIDKFFNYKYGYLEYKSTKFYHQKLDIENFQGTSVMVFNDLDTEHNRIIEHKHFEFLQNGPTWISYEYFQKYVPETTEPLYPVNDNLNNNIYSLYAKEASTLTNIYFGGRLAEYKYYDMHQVIQRALKFVSYL